MVRGGNKKLIQLPYKQGQANASNVCFHVPRNEEEKFLQLYDLVHIDVGIEMISRQQEMYWGKGKPCRLFCK